MIGISILLVLGGCESSFWPREVCDSHRSRGVSLLISPSRSRRKEVADLVEHICWEIRSAC
jgi:hypothetical protein